MPGLPPVSPHLGNTLGETARRQGVLLPQKFARAVAPLSYFELLTFLIALLRECEEIRPWLAAAVYLPTNKSWKTRQLC